MSKTITPKYKIEVGGFTRRRGHETAWKGRVPTLKALEHHVMAEVVSTMPGFVNERIGQAYGIEIPSFARIRENKANGRVLVEWKAAMFTVLPDPKDFPEVARKIEKARTIAEPHTVSDPNTPEAKAAAKDYWESRAKLAPQK